MTARIYKPSQNAMQSGKGSGQWRLEFTRSSQPGKEPLMGWQSSSDTLGRVSIKFTSLDQAIAFAQRNGYSFTVEHAPSTEINEKKYSDNFSTRRRVPWTH